MSHKKHGLRAFGLTLIAALGLMAFMAVSAQANWLVLLNGETLELAAKEEVKVETHQEGNLLYKNSTGTGIEVRCGTVVGEDLLLAPGTKEEATASGKVAFSKCKTFTEGTPQEKCDPINQPIKAGGTAKIFLHEKTRNYVLFSPESGEVFTEIKFSLSCALTETNKVKGFLVAECGLLNGEGKFVGNDCKEHMTSHLLKQAPAALFPNDKLKFGNASAELDGIAKVELAGKDAGQSWSGEV